MSLKLVHTFGRNAGAVQVLDKPVVRFGRAPDGDVVFDANYDRDASANHAEVRRDAGSWVLLDLKSRNGTFVGGQRVERHILRPGDEVTFGPQGPRVRIDFTPSADISPSLLSNLAPKSLPMDPAQGRPAPACTPNPGIPQGIAQQQQGMAPQTPLGPPVAAPPAGQRVGQRTLAMLVSSAVARVQGTASPKMNTQAISQLVDRQVGAATAGQKRTTIVLGLLLVLSFAGLGGLVWWSARSGDQIEDLRAQLNRLPADDKRRQDIEAKLGQLHPPNASTGRNLYDQNKKGIFMLSSNGQGFCTAFAVRPSVLATNAHCVHAARKAGGTIMALENEGRGNMSFSVIDMKSHPSYRENDGPVPSPDVGIMTISGRVATVLNLATAHELTAMGTGDDVYLIGFPGRLMDTANPGATFLAAHIGRITAPNGRPAAFNDSWLVQHDAPTTKGTSGSPIFNARGKVIAINAGGYIDTLDETIQGKKAEVMKASPYKFGMRINLLDAILH